MYGISLSDIGGQESSGREQAAGLMPAVEPTGINMESGRTKGMQLGLATERN
jgi:hypothetical protein